MIKENVRKIKERVALACSRAGRDPASLTIVAVSKGRSAREIKEVVVAGITDIGENRVQEAALKYKELTDELANLRTCEQIKWHMVGHLQTNKVKEAVRIFDLIHCVDSLRLAEEIDKEAKRKNKIQDVLVQVNTSAEKSKFGLRPQEAPALISHAAALKNINITGLMTIAPLTDDPEKARPYFRKLRELNDGLRDLRLATCGLRFLSMGMTDDFEVAVEEGANLLRLGRALFEG